MKQKIASIILAAGRGTRLNSKKVNKVVYPFLGKPMILYGIESLEKVSDIVVVVVGAYTQSVRDVLKDHKKIRFAHQKKRLGTAHAAKAGLELLKKSSPTLVLIGYGDHMMFYTAETIKKLVDTHTSKEAIVSFITSHYETPSNFGFARIERDKNGNILDIIEEKDANLKQKRIKEFNAGFYCFDYEFLQENIDKVKKSPVSGEYYLTDIIRIATSKKLNVVGLPVRFREVGIGVNRHDELTGSQELFKKMRL